MAVRYIKQKDLNYSLWDKCISNAFNGVIYAYSWYLDIVAVHWDALVEDDYRTVMPLIYRKNILYKEIYTPFLTKQLGIFSSQPVDRKKIDTFIHKIPKDFKKINLCLNRHNTQTIGNHFNRSKSVYELDLIVPYEKKSKAYSVNVKNSIKQAKEKGFSLQKGVALYDLENYLNANMKDSIANSITRPLRQILSRLLSIGRAEILGVYNEKNMLSSVACFLRSNQNVILLYAYNLPDRDSQTANYLIMDAFLKNYSARNVTLSLEHFDDHWNSSFYQDFESLPSTCACVGENKLPVFLRWIALNTKKDNFVGN